MLFLLKTGLNYLTSGSSIVNNQNLIIIPMTSRWSSSYDNSTISDNDYLLLDSSSQPVGFPIIFGISALITDVSSSNNLLQLNTTGIDTGSPTSTVATENSSSAQRWLVRDTLSGLDIGYLNPNSLATSVILLGDVLRFADDIASEQRVNHNQNYVFSHALSALYNGELSDSDDLLEMVIIKKTDGSDVTNNDILNVTTGQTVPNLSANGFTIVSDNHPLTGDTTSASSRAAILLPDQSVSLTGINESKCTVLAVLKNTGRSVAKILGMNVSISESIILNNTDSESELILL